jgi:phosphate transport system protein
MASGEREGMETRSHFHAELDALKERVSRLATLVEQSRQDATAAYFEQNMEAAQRVVGGDAAINDQTCVIEEDCLKLLALEQPVALDLRRIVGYSRAVINLERLADEAVTISEGVLTGAGLPGSLDGALKALADQVGRMYARTMAAFADDDLVAAMDVCRLNDQARTLAEAAMRHITDVLAKSQASPEATVRGILAARSLERMGAHAANVAETVVFVLEGATRSQQCQPR